MSKYEELKNRMEEVQHESDVAHCSNVSHAEREDAANDLDQAMHEVSKFERGGAELIERAYDELKKWYEDFCKNTPCSDFQTRKLIEEIEEIEALKGGAK